MNNENERRNDKEGASMVESDNAKVAMEGAMKTKRETVNHPPHYKAEGGIEAIDVIEQFDLGFSLGNAVKYILRAGRKAGAKYSEDLEKAKWYIERELSKVAPWE